MEKRTVSLIIAVAIIVITAVCAIPVAAKEYSLGEDHAHTWTYYSEDDTLCASCDCGAYASVTIDTDPVYEMARHYYGGEVNYSVIRENGWYEFDDILSYIPLYSGYEVFSADNTALYTDIYERPDTNGSYNVRLAVYEDDDPDEGKEIATTSNIPYYLPMVPISECTITEFGDTEIYQGKPEKDSDGTYLITEYVNLAWVGKYDINANVKLMNDIVANPIVVRDDGTVVSARYLIYRHDGLGRSGSTGFMGLTSCGYRGTFDGNGYTVYGLYNDDLSSSYTGLVDRLHLEGCVKNVTVDNFYIIAANAGAIVGCIDEKWGVSDYDVDDIGDGVGIVHDCTVLNGYVGQIGTSSDTCGYAGGVVGCISLESMNQVRYNGSANFLYNCVSYATVSGNCAGGMVGGTTTDDSDGLTLFITNCINVGKITGEYAGGIVGRTNHYSASLFLYISYCKNIGVICGRSVSGGILGYVSNSIYTTIYDCDSYGQLYPSRNVGAYIGNAENIRMMGIYYGTYANADNVIGFDSSIAEFLYMDSYPPTYLDYDMTCLDTLCAEGHTAAPFWELTSVPMCSGNGSMINKCLICDTILAEQDVPADGHMFEEKQLLNSRGKAEYHNICVYCGIDENDVEDDDMTASVFSSYSGKALGVFLIVAAVAVFGAAVYILIKNKRMAKTALSLILVVGILCSSVCIPVSAAECEHDWNIYESGGEICAYCRECGKSAALAVDTSSVNEMNRTYTGSDFEYTIVDDDEWSNCEGLPEYTVVYGGTVSVSATETQPYLYSYDRPTQTGVYTAYIIVKNYRETYRTEKISFYIATIPIDKCTVTDMVDVATPESSSSTYYITTYSELIGATRAINDGVNKGISLSNDIVANPITIRDDGTVVSASYTIYRHEGLGTADNPFTSYFVGNDCTITGLYDVKTDENSSAGLIAYAGGNAEIKSVNISDSFIYGAASGSVCGTLTLDGRTSYYAPLYDCISSYSYISGPGESDSNGQGGIVGVAKLKTDDGAKVIADKCINYSTVNGANSGGIIGLLEHNQHTDYIKITNCSNAGEINGSYSGGIIGRFNSCPKANVWNYTFFDGCKNIGTVKGSCITGGIIGYAYYSIANSASEIEFKKCVSLGCVYAAAKYGNLIGDAYITGGAGEVGVSTENCYIAALNVSNSGLAVWRTEPTVVKMTASELQNICDECDHFEDVRYTSNGLPLCSHNAVGEKRCLICDAVVQTKPYAQNNHKFVDGVCKYCGLDNDSANEVNSKMYNIKRESRMTGSVFSSGSVIAIVGGVAMFAAVAVLGYALVKTKKKRETTAEVETE